MFVWKQDDCKKHFNKKCFIACLLCNFKTIKKTNLQKQVDQHEKTFTIIISIVMKCCGLYCTSGTSVISQQCICYEFDSSFGFFSFSFFHLCHLWSIVELIFSLNYFLKAKLKQYPFRDSISCIMKHQWRVHHFILSPFQL